MPIALREGEKGDFGSKKHILKWVKWSYATTITVTDCISFETHLLSIFNVPGATVGSILSLLIHHLYLGSHKTLAAHVHKCSSYTCRVDQSVEELTHTIVYDLTEFALANRKPVSLNCVGTLNALGQIEGLQTDI